jgi:hypothetical protein
VIIRRESPRDCLAGGWNDDAPLPPMAAWLGQRSRDELLVRNRNVLENSNTFVKRLLGKNDPFETAEPPCINTRRASRELARGTTIACS